jgi:hypothetical protein
MNHIYVNLSNKESDDPEENIATANTLEVDKYEATEVPALVTLRPIPHEFEMFPSEDQTTISLDVLRKQFGNNETLHWFKNDRKIDRLISWIEAIPDW